jgi:hypothetical protein
MDFSLVTELKTTCVDTGYFVELTPVGNSQFNLGKSRDEFKSEINQGTCRTPITWRKEDTTHSSWMKEL